MKLDLDVRDAHVYGGLALVAVGVGWAWLPGACIVLGLGLMYVALRRV